MTLVVYDRVVIVKFVQMYNSQRFCQPAFTAKLTIESLITAKLNSWPR
jgi:hypothetical protein